MPVGTSSNKEGGFVYSGSRDGTLGDNDLILGTRNTGTRETDVSLSNGGVQHSENGTFLIEGEHSENSTPRNGAQNNGDKVENRDSNRLENGEEVSVANGDGSEKGQNGVNDEEAQHVEHADGNNEGNEDEVEDKRELIDIVGETEMMYQEYCLRSKSEESNDVTGMAATKYNCQMLLCDHGNGIIKLVDRFFNIVFKYYSCFKPFGVAVLDVDFFVVTYPFVRLMQYFKFKGGNSKFAPWFPVKAQNEYYGVCGVQDRIVTVCKYDGDNMKDIPSVHILNRGGMVLHIVSKNADGEQLFVDPEQIAIHSKTRLVYVSDHGAGKVVCLNLAGDILSTFFTNEFNPTGISVDDSKGWVYVSDKCKERIIKLNQELEPVQKILAKCDTMPLLLASMYCSRSDRLIVSLEESVYLKSFVL